ncbi:hypothetical protein [Mesorhizobium sp. M0496]|uniref:hypothetical protein n=1 Tax=Mesorhizobium sp. M0496 TaxID=2956952 RepID=UPI003336A351
MVTHVSSGGWRLSPILLPDRRPTASARWFRISAPAEYVWSRHLMERVNNTVRLKVWKGNVIVAGRKGPDRLPPPHLQEISVHDQRDAQGFVKLSTLRLLPGAPRSPRPMASSGNGKRPPKGRGAVPYRFSGSNEGKVRRGQA